MPNFRRGSAGMPEEGGKRLTMYDFGLLSDIEKEELCRELLNEFGADVVKVNPNNGEMLHSCCLPWGHADSNPSASLNYKTLLYNCYVCGGGSIIWLIGACRHGDTAAARKWLVERTGINREQDLDVLLTYFDAMWNQAENRPPPIPHMNPSILDPWMLIHPYLTDPREEGGRGIPEETVCHFKAGWDSVANRIVIPHFWKGDLVGWQTRRLSDDGSEKYKNTSEFPKDRTIYNYDPKQREIIVVESAMSVLSKYHLTPNIVATFGSEVNEAQIRYLNRFDRVTLWFDNDKAGWKTTNNVAEALTSYCPVYVVDSPYAADPADLDDETYMRLLATAVPYSLWSQPTELQEWTHEEVRQ